jgi:hypothetical protein
MRAKLKDLRRHPTWIGSWWLDWPARHRQFWRVLLLDPGQGWFRWGIAYRTSYTYLGEGLNVPEDYPCAPPLRRAAMSVRTVWDWLLNRHGFREDAPWPGFRAAGGGMWMDDDRSRELWGW